MKTLVNLVVGVDQVYELGVRNPAGDLFSQLILRLGWADRPDTLIENFVSLAHRLIFLCLIHLGILALTRELNALPLHIKQIVIDEVRMSQVNYFELAWFDTWSVGSVLSALEFYAFDQWRWQAMVF